jgi:hypothetical protein
MAALCDRGSLGSYCIVQFARTVRIARMEGYQDQVNRSPCARAGNAGAQRHLQEKTLNFGVDRPHLAECTTLN